MLLMADTTVEPLVRWSSTPKFWYEEFARRRSQVSWLAKILYNPQLLVTIYLNKHHFRTIIVTSLSSLRHNMVPHVFLTLSLHTLP